MATKKQKRAAALADREQFLKDEAARGLEAQRRDREAQAERHDQLMMAAEEINDRHRKILSGNGIHE